MLRRMADRAFPMVFATRVAATVAFYEHFGFRAFFPLPPDGNPVALAQAAPETL